MRSKKRKLLSDGKVFQMARYFRWQGISGQQTILTLFTQLLSLHLTRLKLFPFI
jgi:hypothetical protein